MLKMEMNEFIEQACNQYSQDKYAMYLRKSRTDLEMEALGEGETLARHLHMLEALAAKHGISMNQITIYKELVSGDSIDERPEMQKLLADVYAKKYKGVLVVEVERLARGNTRDQGEVADAFQYSNTHIITPAKVYDPNNEFDQEYFEFGLFMSRREYKTIKRRLESGKKSSVEEGNYLLPIPPYGYDVVRTSKKDRFLVEKPEESKIVKMMFAWYTEERKSTSWIARTLTNMKVPTPRGGQTWARSSVKEILFNAHYIGKVSWGDQRTVRQLDPNTGKSVKKTIFTKEPTLYEGKHEAIISEEQFWKVRTIYGANAPLKWSTELVNPLSGIMKCCDCGKGIGYIRFKDGRVARFQHPFGQPCKKPSVHDDVLFDTLINTLNASIADFQRELDALNNKSDYERHQDMIKTMESELVKIEKRKRKLMDSWESEDGMYTKEEFIERKQMYTAAIESLKEKISEEKMSAPNPVDYQAKIATLHQIIECIKDPEISAKTKNVFLKKFIDKITYDVIDNGVRNKIPVLKVYLK